MSKTVRSLTAAAMLVSALPVLAGAAVTAAALEVLSRTGGSR